MVRDDGETVGLFEPLMVSEGSLARAGLNDLVLELAEKSAGFRSSLPASMAAMAGNKPAAPTMAAITVSTSCNRETSHNAALPLRTSVFRSFSRNTAGSAASPS